MIELDQAGWLALPKGVRDRADKAHLENCPYTLCDHHGGVVLCAERFVRGKTERLLFFAFCNSCNARGPRLLTPEEAAEVWNERDPAKQVDIGP